ncbi:MAG: M15 family metallopeptidase [Acidimicrobiia bacterium]|nr:M15 family metallopeptidase [Acidimicrobiia bacterium]
MRFRVVVLLILIGSASCSSAAPVENAAAKTVATTSIPSVTSPVVQSTTTPSTVPLPTTTTTISPFARPAWLGTRPLPLRPDEHGEVQPTPPEFVDRRLATPDVLPPPGSDEFIWTIGSIPEDVLARSSWVPECPVGIDDLAYVTVSHLGFDEEFHTGEIIVNASVAMGVVDVFRQLHEARFPLEQMRVITKEEIDAPPTGDWNDTTSFVCRPAVGSTGWSQHAYGFAIDINPFHNPYLKGDLVLPELASAYLDRSDLRPGMIEPGDVVIEAFRNIGWSWGGNWNTLKDWMHFSKSGG